MSGRRSVRLPGHDYEGGLYFVTVCTHGHACLFGEVTEDGVLLNAFGRIVEEEWRRTAEIRAEVVTDAFVVMPNHVHLLVGIVPPLLTPAPNADYTVGAQRAAPLRAIDAAGRFNVAPRSLGAIVRAFKSASTRRINALRATPGAPVWQRGYHEHVVRDDRTRDRIRRYIADNPLRWHLDRYHPDRA